MSSSSKRCIKTTVMILAITHIKYTVCIYTSVFVLITVSARIENSSQLTSCIYLFAVWSNLHSFCPQTFVEFSYKSGLGNSYSTSNLQ